MGMMPQTFDFESNAVRVQMIEDAPWFIAADVCRVLGLVNHRDALEKLDDDEKGVALTDTLGGAQNTAIISESGLYTLILRCRDAVTPGTPAHRFRKWVTAEVLPAIRRYGSYSAEVDEDLLPNLEDGKLWGQSVAKVNAAARMISVVRTIYGPDAARFLYEKEKGLPSLKKLSVIAIEENPETDPRGAFRQLMRCAAGNAGTVGSLLDLALRDEVAARRLVEFGIKVTNPGRRGDIAIANEHRFLASTFAMTPWAKEWRLAFALLPGAKPSKQNVSFGEHKSKAVLLPHETVVRLRNP